MCYITKVVLVEGANLCVISLVKCPKNMTLAATRGSRRFPRRCCDLEQPTHLSGSLGWMTRAKSASVRHEFSAPEAAVPMQWWRQWWRVLMLRLREEVYGLERALGGRVGRKVVTPCSEPFSMEEKKPFAAMQGRVQASASLSQG